VVHHPGIFSQNGIEAQVSIRRLSQGGGKFSSPISLASESAHPIFDHGLSQFVCQLIGDPAQAEKSRTDCAIQMIEKWNVRRSEPRQVSRPNKNIFFEVSRNMVVEEIDSRSFGP
jgi:hypothetical protein